MTGLHKINSVDNHIAAKLKKFRIERGIGIEELGEIVGLSFQQIQKYEKAVNKISASKLFEIAHALNQPVAAFFNKIKISGKYYNVKIKSEKQRTKESYELSKDLLPLVRSFNLIQNAQLKKQIVNLVREISGPHSRKKNKHIYS